KVYLCNSSFPCTSYQIGSFSYAAGLVGGGSVKRVQLVSVDRNLVTGGNYYLTVVINADGGVYEGVPGSPAVLNDVGVSAQPVNIQLEPLPELVISQVDGPTNPV